MCTVTFVPRQTGYYLAMNRDEHLTRVPGLPPVQRIVNRHAVLYPSEPGGGTWIVLNDRGVTFALINWYSVKTRVKSRRISRGEVVNSVSAFTAPDVADAALGDLQLSQINPFRLIGVFPKFGEVVEWFWDLEQLVRKTHRWRAQQWISSGFDEPAAQRVRSKTFRQAQKQRSVATLDWLRRLHCSHSPKMGPFSTCMHRTDAATVSYTEVTVSASRARMHYRAGAPCQSSGGSLHHLERKR